MIRIVRINDVLWYGGMVYELVGLLGGWGGGISR